MISSPILTATLADADGETRNYTVQTDNRNIVHFDMNRARLNLPAQKDAPQLWVTYLVWHALSIAGHLPDNQTFEAFNGRCLDVFASDETGNRLSSEQIESRNATLFPTQPDHASGS